MAETPGASNIRISVSEDKLNLALRELELRIVDRLRGELAAKADAQVVRELRDSVHSMRSSMEALSLAVATVAQHEDEIKDLKRDVTLLREDRAASQGLSGYQRWLIVGVVIPLLGVLATLVWLAVGSTH